MNANSFSRWLYLLRWFFSSRVRRRSGVLRVVRRQRPRSFGSSMVSRYPMLSTGRVRHASVKSGSPSLRATLDMIDKPNIVAAIMSVPDAENRQALIDFIAEQSRLLSDAHDTMAKQNVALRTMVQEQERRVRIVNLCQEALGQLRLDIKYLGFDLDATRRERDEARRKLDERNGS